MSLVEEERHAELVNNNKGFSYSYSYNNNHVLYDYMFW